MKEGELEQLDEKQACQGDWDVRDFYIGKKANSRPTMYQRYEASPHRTSKIGALI